MVPFSLALVGGIGAPQVHIGMAPGSDALGMSCALAMTKWPVVTDAEDQETDLWESPHRGDVLDWHKEMQLFASEVVLSN